MADSVKILSYLICVAFLGQVCAQGNEFYLDDEPLHTNRKEPGLKWLVGYIDVGDDNSTGLIHLRFISTDELRVTWFAGDSFTSLAPIIEVGGLKDETHTEHKMPSYYIQSTSLEWDIRNAVPGSYCFQYSLSASDGSIWYTRKVTLQDLVDRRQSDELRNPVPIRPTSIVQAFPTAYRYKPNDGQQRMEVISAKFYIPEFDASHFQMTCDSVDHATDERKALYYQQGQEPTHSIGGDISVNTARSGSDGLQITLDLTLQLGSETAQSTYWCTILHGDEELGILMDVLKDTSHSALPEGYDQVPKMRVDGMIGYGTHSRGSLGEEGYISCHRVTALPGEHMLMLVHEGEALNISSANRWQIQRGTLHEEWLRYSIPAFSIDDAGIYTCWSETGQSSSTAIIT